MYQALQRVRHNITISDIECNITKFSGEVFLCGTIWSGGQEAAPNIFCLPAPRVRACANHFGISKSTVHKDVAERLKDSDAELYAAVRKVLDKNLSERHIRGGIATRNKYRRKKSCRADAACCECACTEDSCNCCTEGSCPDCANHCRDCGCRSKNT